MEFCLKRFKIKKALFDIPNLKKLEIDITYFCNLTCSGCSRSSAQAPSNKHMSLNQIQEFLEETDRKGHKWESIHLLVESQPCILNS